ncbi:MAG: hypothetical protein J6I73_01155 [Treponema sp.]|nr:hypothetical protein [Treponema sp.]
MDCWRCGKQAGASEKIVRTTTCTLCGADLHCCRGCAFYSPGAHYDCRETVEELVKDKERANFCDSFSPQKKSALDGNTAAREKAKAAFNNLFSD